MEKYSKYVSCPKCDFGKRCHFQHMPERRHYTSTTITVFKEEHIKVSCDGCHYTWEMKTKDSE